jgi:hypothetical protein
MHEVFIIIKIAFIFLVCGGGQIPKQKELRYPVR